MRVRQANLREEQEYRKKSKTEREEKNMKKIMCLTLAMLLVACASLTIVASAETLTPANDSVITGIINVEDLENDPDVVVSEPMTYEEMVSQYAKNTGKTYDEAIAEMPGEVRSTRAAKAKTYRTFSVLITVTSSYRPSIDYYCETSEGGNFFNINKIYAVELNRGYNGISKQFDGTIKSWLRSAISIEYIINGDFYNNGTTTKTGGVNLNLGINELASVSFSASIANTSNHYKYCYESGTKVFGH